MTFNPYTTGKVDWTGENPGILLKDEHGEFSAMALFFRVVWSPVGGGELLLLYGDPQAEKGPADRPNALIGDSPQLAEHLMHNFIGKLEAFRKARAFSGLTFEKAKEIRTTGDPFGKRFIETVATETLTVELVWEDLETPKLLRLTPEETGTKEHYMTTILVPARTGKILVNGNPLPGQLGTRIQAGFETTTAFLYFGETWVFPDT